MTMLYVVIACGLLSVVYAIWATQSVLAADQGNAAHAGNLRRHPRGRAGLSRAPVHDHRHRRRGRLPARLVAALGDRRDRLPDRRRAFGRCRLHRHARLGARQCAHRAGRLQQPRRRPRHRLQVGRHHRHAGRRPRAARRLRLLLDPDRPDGLCAGRPHGHRRAGRARLRRFADLDLRPSRRRHLHQGRRRRRRSRRQGRSRHSRRRSAQPGHHRRQCRRQCRRLRRHGGRPVRDLCGDRRRHHGARRRSSSAARRCSATVMLYPLAICGACIITSIVGTFFVKLGSQRLDHGRALQGPDRHRPAVDRRPRRRHLADHRLGRDRHRRRRRRSPARTCSSAASSAWW